MRLPGWSIPSGGQAGENDKMIWRWWLGGGQTYGRKVGVCRVDSHHRGNVCQDVEHEGEVLENLQIYKLCLVGASGSFSVKLLRKISSSKFIVRRTFYKQ